MTWHWPATPKDFPSSLYGGEGIDAHDHRIGETERQSPRIDTPDPAGAPSMEPAPHTEREHGPATSADFPSSLYGGEGSDARDHRIGETERQSPRIDTPDPGGAPHTEREHGPAMSADFPGALYGGEGSDANDHRIGETQRQSPRIDKPDPGGATEPQRKPELNRDQEERRGAR